jgi:flagellin
LAISIATNLAALRAQRQVSFATGKLRSTYEELSSGSRINQAADDAAGLATSELLRLQSRVAEVALRNANDGISIVRIADGALGQITSVLTRMAELAEQGATGTIGDRIRSALQLEFVALGSEVQRIAETTQFNGMPLISGAASIVLQVGYNSASTSNLTVTAVQGTLEGIRLASTGANQLNYQVIGNTELESQANSRTALEAVLEAIQIVAANRGSLGADENRLASSVSTLQSSRENFLRADSRIRDVDVGEAASQALKLEIVQQAGTAILAQANQQPALALTLLKPPGR